MSVDTRKVLRRFLRAVQGGCRTPEEHSVLLRTVKNSVETQPTFSRLIHDLGDALPDAMRVAYSTIKNENDLLTRGRYVVVTRPGDRRTGQRGIVIGGTPNKGVEVIFGDGRVEGFLFSSVALVSPNSTTAPSVAAGKKRPRAPDGADRPFVADGAEKQSYLMGVQEGIKSQKLVHADNVRIARQKVTAILEDPLVSDLEKNVKILIVLSGLE